MEKYFGNERAPFVWRRIRSQHQLGSGKSRDAVLGTKSNFSKGGYNNGVLTTYTIAAVANQEIVVMDVSISGQFSYDIELIFSTSGGEEIGRYKTWNYSNYPGPGTMSTSLNSGLRVPAGEDLQVTVNGKGTFTFAGKYVHP